MKTPVDDEDGLLPVLVMIDQETGCTFSAVTAKGVNAYSVHVVVEMLKFLGRQRVILMTDGEPAIRALAEPRQNKLERELSSSMHQRRPMAKRMEQRNVLSLRRPGRLEHWCTQWR